MGQYPADWGERRQAVYRRDEYTCQQCGAGGGPNGGAELHAHHIMPRAQGGSDAYENLLTLCQRCHSQVHGRPVGSAAFARKEPARTPPREWKWGTPMQHAIIALLTLWFTLGIGNLVYAIIHRFSYSLSRLTPRLSPW